MNITLDIILLAVLVISFVIGYKKGFVKSVWKIVALVVTIVLVLALKTPTVNFLAGSALANNISTKIAENVNIPQGGGVDIAETLNLPEFIQSDMTNQIDSTNNAVNSINEKTVMWLTNLCLTVITCVALFIIIRLILMAVYMIINGITEAPIIKGVNKFMGGIFATINIIFIINIRYVYYNHPLTNILLFFSTCLFLYLWLVQFSSICLSQIFQPIHMFFCELSWKQSPSPVLTNRRR